MSDDESRRPHLRLVPGTSDADTTPARETGQGPETSPEERRAWPPPAGYWSSLYDLTNQTALILGTTEPLGLGIATGLADFGARVAVAERDLEMSKLAAKAATRRGHQSALAMNLDPARPEQVRRGIAAIEQLTGGIDVLVAVVSLGTPFRVANSGSAPATLTLPEVIHLVRATGRRMAVRGGGRVLLVAAGVPGDPAIAALAIGGLNEFVRTMAAAFIPHGVSVNALIVPQLIEPATSAPATSAPAGAASSAAEPTAEESRPEQTGAPAPEEKADPLAEVSGEAAPLEDEPNGDDLVLSQAPVISFPAGSRAPEAPAASPTAPADEPATEGILAAGIGAALYLCSPPARYLTGQSVTVGNPTVIGVKSPSSS